MKTVKLLIVGLDAATLDLINPWVAKVSSRISHA